MKLEQQVCSLDLARRLKELGVKQESLFNWCKHSGRFGKWHIRLSKGSVAKEYFSAYSVAELGEMLPAWYRTGKNIDGEEKWTGGFWCGGLAMGTKTHFADTEADARAKMLCYLLENNLIN